VPLFGPVHLALLLTIVSASATLSWLCRERKLPLLTVRLVLAYGIAANELVWWVFRYSHEGVHLTNLPFQLCDLTVWMTVLACLTKIPWAVEFAYFSGLAGSGMAVLTPDLWTPWPSYPAIYFFVAHGGVLVACSVLTFGKIAELRAGAVWRAFGILAGYAVIVGAFDAITAPTTCTCAGNRLIRPCSTGLAHGPGTCVAAWRLDCCFSGHFGCRFDRPRGFQNW
jgi:hypothetical integral membrane protein (TIGR02206 family)